MLCMKRQEVRAEWEMEHKKVVEKIRNYPYYKARLEEAQKQLESICIKLTPPYGNLAPSSGSTTSNSVEKLGIRRNEIKSRILDFQREIYKIRCMIESSGLTEQEKHLMWWIAKNGQLAAYARLNHIGKDNVYKIRDRAVDKIIKAQNAGL